MKGVRIALTSLLAVTVIGIASARGEGFTFPNLNPFSGKKTEASRSGISKNASLSRARPKMETPQLRRSATGKSHSPTTWQKMQQGTGQFFSSLTSWSRPKQTKPASRQTKPKSKSSPFAWLFPKPEEEPPIRSVNEYLSLPQPGIDD